jgi:hypothetical protein
VALLSAAGIGRAHAAVCRVSPAGSSNGTGSWFVPFDMQTALGKSACTEIWVRAGVYKPGTAASDTFAIRAGTAVYGGFSGYESSRDQRQPASNRSILSGDIGNNDSTDALGITRLPGDIVGTNSTHVVTLDGSTIPIGNDTILDGFTITAGDNTGDADGGGGLRCFANGSSNPEAQCSPRLQNLVLSGNRAYLGGGMMLFASAGAASSAILANVAFRGNLAHGFGGALDIQADNAAGNPILSNATFINNHAILAGGAMLSKAYGSGTLDLNLFNATFVGNHANNLSGAAELGCENGGASNLILRNVTFNANDSDTNGAVSFAGSNCSLDVVLSNVISWGNSANTDPEILDFDTVPAIDHSVIQGSGGSANWDTNLGSDNGGNLDADPRLGPLQDNGSGMLTMLPMMTSPAIDAGNDDTCPDIDQRGISRPQGWHCDIGATEAVIVDRIIAVSGSGQSREVWQDFYNPLTLQVLDSQGLAAPGVRVHAESAPAMTAAADCTDATTNGSGFAYIYCRANGLSGTYVVDVHVIDFANVTPADFVLTNTAGNGDTIFVDGFDPPGPL